MELVDYNNKNPVTIYALPIYIAAIRLQRAHVFYNLTYLQHMHMNWNVIGCHMEVLDRVF